MQYRKDSRVSGFSLVELSIVLVILGLLAGGILTGQSLIRAAELRSVTVEYSAYQTAAASFRDKYFAIPGDMKNATDFWGTSANCPGTAVQGSTDETTCNGDGDTRIENSLVNTATAEEYRYWQHLANAGLIEGQYPGVIGSGGFQHSVLGSNVPQSKLSDGGYHIGWIGSLSANGAYFDATYNNALFFGGQSGAGIPTARILLPEEAWGIDKKMDDGMPAAGKVMTFHNHTGCSDAADGTDDPAYDDLDAVYELDNTTKACSLIFPRFN